VLVTALLISGSQVRALLGSPFSMFYGRLKNLPFFVCANFDQLEMPNSYMRQRIPLD
jgi:hypothetical protein